MSPTLREKTNELLAKKAEIKKMGPPEALERQRQAGKMNARERLAYLLDPGSFVELGIHGHHQNPTPQMQGEYTPADGVIAGIGEIAGRKICLAAYDFSVMAGSIGEISEKKVTRLRELAMRELFPMVWLLDSAGARVSELSGSEFAGSGKLFFDQVTMSGLVPQVAAVMGPCAAGTAYIPALADFVPMVKGTSSMALAGPPLVEAVIGEKISMEDLGGSSVHCYESGVADAECANDRECLDVIRKYLSYFPAHCGESPPLAKSQDHWSLSADAAPDLRCSDEILQLLPANPKAPYDMKKILALIADDGNILEIKKNFGASVITALSRVGGYSVGIIANQPLVKGGILDNDSSDKAARFIELCDAFNIPLLYLQDVPGFMVGSAVERAGIIRHGAKFLYATSHATVPKITIVIRKAYGAGYYVMCGRGYAPDLLLAWPSAEIGLMGPEGAVMILFRKEIAASDAPEKRRAELIEIFREKIDIEKAATRADIDEIIDPRDTRYWIVKGLQIAANKQRPHAPKRHGVMPV